jgi:hypothetical protein
MNSNNHKTGASLSERDEHTLLFIRGEIKSARKAFPSNTRRHAALVEEVGKTAQALIEHSQGNAPPEAVVNEAVQVAAMAVRLATEGSNEFPYDPGEVFGD